MTIQLQTKKILVFVLAGVSYGAGLFFSNPAGFGLCSGLQTGSYICRVPGAVNIGWPIIALGQMLAIVAVVLLLANADTFRRWLKFSVLYIPIAVLLALWIYPFRIPPGSVVPISQGVYPFGWLFVIISLGIVLVSWFRNRR